jgi:replicative DNA helicase
MKAFTYEEALKHYQKNMDRALEAPNFGYVELIQRIPGLLPGQLTVLAAGTSMGKTVFLANVAAHMVTEQKKKVVFFSLESGDSVAGVIYKLTGKKELPNLTILTGEGGTNITEVKKYLRDNLHKADVGIIDHIHYLHRSIAGQNTQATIGDLIREIQLMAKEFEIPVIVVSHIRKLQRENDIPGLHDLKDSSSLYQDPSTVLILHRFKKEAINLAIGMEQMYANNGLLIIAKNRDFGMTGTLKLEFDPDNLAFAVGDEWLWQN